MRKISPKQAIVGIAVIVLIIIAIVLVVSNTNNGGKGRTATIHIKNGTFIPATITVEKGTKVVWIVDDEDVNYKVAANPYPSHSSLPSLVSGVLHQDDQYSYTFTQSGKIGYHNDNNPTMNGTVIVK